MNEQLEPSLTVNINEAIRLLSIGRTSLYKLIKAGKIKTVTIAGRVLIERSELERIARTGADLNQ